MLVAVLDWQENFARESTAKIDKYLRILNEQTPEGGFDTPAWLVPPYFYDTRAGGHVYRLSLRMARMAQRRAGDERVHPIVCVLKSALALPADVQRIIKDHARFSQTILHISKFDETKASLNELGGFWTLVAGLANRDRPPLMLYGGYFSVLAFHAGLDGLSHGVGYGEYRDALNPRSGPPGDRFYIPALHHFFSLGEAQALLRTDQANRQLLQCACAQCAVALAAGRSALAQRTREDIFVHYLQARHTEITVVQQRPLAELLDDLRQMHAYARLLAPAMANEFDYLEQWRKAVQIATGI